MTKHFSIASISTFSLTRPLWRELWWTGCNVTNNL